MPLSAVVEEAASSKLLLLQNLDTYGGESGGAGSEFNPILIQLALLCTVVGSCISFFSVWLHWKNYRKPNQQRQVIRILWMVPIYGISTYISLVSLNVAFYVDTFRDIYEAFVIYAFFNLLLNKLGGERALIIMLHSRPPSQNFFPGTLYSREIFVGDPYTFLFVKRGILQFVYVKPILAILTMILKATGNYNEGQFTWSSSYAWLTFFYNLSVCLSLWCLMVFFYATKKDLTSFRPLPKFLCVKAIIFFSFWQGVVVALLVFAGIIPEAEHISVAIQDFLVCIEMVPFAIAHSFSFSYEDYFDQTVHSARMPIRKAIKDSFGLKDVVMDTLTTMKGSGFSYRSFEPSEGVPHMGSSRTSRIMAGLRYSNITTKKRWLEPVPTSRFLTSSGRGMNDEVQPLEEPEPLAFDDPDPSDPMEALYEASRKMVFGDYNYPVVDFRVPLWRLARQERRRQQRGYGTSSITTTISAGMQQQGQEQHNNYISSLVGEYSRKKKKSKRHQRRNSDENLIGPREGCIDVIIEQGKGHYVLVDDLSDEEAQLPVKELPSLPSRKPTLSNIKRADGPFMSASTPTTTAKAVSPKIAVMRPILSNTKMASSSSTIIANAIHNTNTNLDKTRDIQSSSSTSTNQRYPSTVATVQQHQQQQSNNVKNTIFSTSPSQLSPSPRTSPTITTNNLDYQQQQPYIAHNYSHDNPSDTWQWSQRNNNIHSTADVSGSNKNSDTLSEEEILSSDVWK